MRAAATDSTGDPEVLVEQRGATGFITLNRPKALNALNLTMVQRLLPVMREWAAGSAGVGAVVVKGAGGKAFCAGGDVRALTEAGARGEDLPNRFFTQEYTLNHLIGSYPLPYVAIIHGVCMGGGVGLSVHGRYRVATEKTLFAMPETGIGLFPDVGGGYFLPRLPLPGLGMFLALTGHRLKGADVFKAGVATHFVQSAELPALEAALAEVPANGGHDAVQAVLRQFHAVGGGDAHEFSLAPHAASIAARFAGQPDVESLCAALEADGSEWALQHLATLRKMSPTSLKISHRQLTSGAEMTLPEVLAMEYRMGSACMRHKDFYEGIRSVLVDRDNAPAWSPPTLEEVGAALVDDHFAPVSDELVLG